MQKLGVCSDCPRDRATEEIALGRRYFVDVLLVFLGCAFRQMELQFVAVLERFVDNQGILADDLVRLKPEQPFSIEYASVPTRCHQYLRSSR